MGGEVKMPKYLWIDCSRLSHYSGSVVFWACTKIVRVNEVSVFPVGSMTIKLLKLWLDNIFFTL